MTDYSKLSEPELNRLCAEKMGYKLVPESDIVPNGAKIWYKRHSDGVLHLWDGAGFFAIWRPVNNTDQAIEFLNKFGFSATLTIGAGWYYAHIDIDDIDPCDASENKSGKALVIAGLKALEEVTK